MKRIKTFIYFLILILIYLAPLGVLGRITLVRNVNIYPQDLVVVLLLSIVFFLVLTRKIKISLKILLPLIFFNITAIIGLGLNNLNLSQLATSLLYLVRFDLYFSLIFLTSVKFSSSQLERIRSSFFVATFVTALIGLVQYFLYKDLRNLFYLGWDEHLYRLFGSFLDPNYTGLFFAIILIAVIGNTLDGHLKKSKNTMILSATIFLAIVLTYSRTALVSLVGGLMYLFVGIRKIKLIFLSLLLVSLFVLLVSDFDIEGLNPLRTASSEARVGSFIEASKIFQDNFLFGVGFNAYRYEQLERGFKKENSIISNADAGTDNSIMFILATTGIFGLISYAFLWILVLKDVFIERRVLKITLYAMLVALLIGSQFINALFYMPIMVWVFLYVAFFTLKK